jgi:hypothetical protein
MMVVTLIPRLRGGQVLIVASVATPTYQTCATRAREAVLRDDLFTLRASSLLSPPRKACPELAEGRGSTHPWIPAPPPSRRTSFAGMTST